MKKHLMIGLGGTGLAVLHAVRRCLVQEGRAGGSPRANLRFSANDGSTRFAANQSQQYASETTSSHKMVRELACNVPTRAVRETTIYIYSSLAGGTGSGVFLDIAFEIKRLRIVEYGLLCAPNHGGTRNPQAEASNDIRECNGFASGDDVESQNTRLDQDKAVRLRYRQPGAVHSSDLDDERVFCDFREHCVTHLAERTAWEPDIAARSITGAWITVGRLQRAQWLGMLRVRHRQMQPFFCDKVRNVVSYDARSSIEFSETRKFGVSPVLASQCFEQGSVQPLAPQRSTRRHALLEPSCHDQLCAPVLLSFSVTSRLSSGDRSLLGSSLRRLLASRTKPLIRIPVRAWTAKQRIGRTLSAPTRGGSRCSRTPVVLCSRTTGRAPLVPHTACELDGGPRRQTNSF